MVKERVLKRPKQKIPELDYEHLHLRRNMEPAKFGALANRKLVADQADVNVAKKWRDMATALDFDLDEDKENIGENRGGFDSGGGKFGELAESAPEVNDFIVEESLNSTLTPANAKQLALETSPTLFLSYSPPFTHEYMKGCPESGPRKYNIAVQSYNSKELAEQGAKEQDQGLAEKTPLFKRIEAIVRLNLVAFSIILLAGLMYGIFYVFSK